MIGVGMTLATAAPFQARSQTPSADITPSTNQAGALQGLLPFKEPPAFTDVPPLATASAARNGQKDAVRTLPVYDAEYPIWNPVTQRYDRVSLRTYWYGKGTPLVGRTWETTPGSDEVVVLQNHLPDDADLSCKQAEHAKPNIPHCFNNTNLHTHGLWVSPLGNSDNVLINVHPGQSFKYEYHIPPDHPAGTYWYHAHLHGSTALQVGSGMAGALIIRGNRTPTASTQGDIDTLLSKTPLQPFPEHVLAFQQIQYYCVDSHNKIKRNSDQTYRCDAGDVGRLDNFDDLGGAGTGWETSGRYTIINGQVAPWFRAKTGQIERWRMIHAGVRDTINLRFIKLREQATSPAGLPVLAQKAYIDQNCTGATTPQYLIAADGITMGNIHKSDQTVFQPGYRWDALMNFREPGVYCMIDEAMPLESTVISGEHSRRLLGMVYVTGAAMSDDSTEYVREQLVDAATRNMPQDVRQQVIDDLNNGMQLGKFTPHPDIKDSELTGQQKVVYDIVNPRTPKQALTINGKAFDMSNPPRKLPLGGVEEWTITSRYLSHPHHIHVNAFQIVAIYDENGKEVSAPNASDGQDPQYPGLKGVWKDTIWVKNPAAKADPKKTYTVIYRTRYERYTGLQFLNL